MLKAVLKVRPSTKNVIFVGLLLLFKFTSSCQCLTNNQFYNKLIKVEQSFSLSAAKRLREVENLQKRFEECKLIQDSVYARILHRRGALLYSIGNLNDAIRYTLQSVTINTTQIKGSSGKYAIRSYCNLGGFYKLLNQYKSALAYFDKCITEESKYKDFEFFPDLVEARMSKGNIYYQNGDYQKSIEELTQGLEIAYFLKDSIAILKLLNERSEAYAGMKLFDQAIADVNAALLLIEKTDYEALANNNKIRAIISEAHNNYSLASAYNNKAINMRLRTGNINALSKDYLDIGNSMKAKEIANKTMKFSAARNFYNQSLLLAQKTEDHIIAAKALNNLGFISLITQNYSKALTEYHNSLLQIAPTLKDTNALNNPAYYQCNAISDKNFLSLLLGNKTECLLYLYKQNSNKKYLSAALKTALLTDSLITDMRHEQTGEQSKLYWRDETREFFTNSIEACYQAKDSKLAFYFMEKSRAVLLNDKLNELGASAYLPPTEAQKEQSMQINVLSLQQQLAQLSDTDKTFNEQQVKLLQAKEDLDNYIKTLQDKYPAYYQYKYADDVPKLIDLQKYLYNNKQGFVHYFITDSSVYMLGITATSSKFIKLDYKQFNEEQFRFLKMCSDKQFLNNHNDSFAALSHKIYEILFKPLQLHSGRVIVCYDSYLIPFEALTTDEKGEKFLINNYTFSYVYSARFLLKKFNNPRGSGNFLGVAPVSYAAYLHVPDLTQSERSLDESASYFHTTTLITNREASRSNLLKLLPAYTVITVFSHARADSTDKEPVLFMADSVISLSELQLLRNPATRLVVLSACQTNVGKIAAGEGIISLARGFSSAGIPCIAATLWKADEKAIYNITNAFLQNISTGMRKDDALQKAKLAYMRNGDDKLLPFYWANMILAGNGESVNLSQSNYLAALITGTVFITAILIFFIIYFRRKRSKTIHFN